MTRYNTAYDDGQFTEQTDDLAKALGDALLEFAAPVVVLFDDGRVTVVEYDDVVVSDWDGSCQVKKDASLVFDAQEVSESVPA